VAKRSQKMWVISVIFIKVPKVNNHALGENSPNLVTPFLTASFALGTNVMIFKKFRRKMWRKYWRF
jgi:hypothetical protein